MAQFSPKAPEAKPEVKSEPASKPLTEAKKTKPISWNPPEIVAKFKKYAAEKKAFARAKREINRLKKRRK